MHTSRFKNGQIPIRKSTTRLVEDRVHSIHLYNQRRYIMRRILLLAVALLLSSSVYAQLGISLGFNVESQPAWGPTGYDHVDYYYMPDIGVYYNVPQHLYYYNEGGRWVGRSSLPRRYRDYDMYHSYKVVVNERNPYMHDNIYREKYSSYKGRHDQEVIRDSHDSRYFVNKGHPEHKNWVKQQSHGNDKGNNGNGRGNGGNHERERKH